MTKRLSVNINDETAHALRSLAERKQTSVTEIVRRSIGPYAFVEVEKQKGNDFAIVDRKKRTSILVVK